MIRKNDINLAPVNDATAAVVLYANVGNVDTVIADGVIHKRHGTLVNEDLPELINQLQESTTRVLERSGDMDLAERIRACRQIFPIDRRSRFEQRFAAWVFRSGFQSAHSRLIEFILNRAR